MAKPTAYVVLGPVSPNNPGEAGILVSVGGILLGADDMPVTGPGVPATVVSQIVAHVGDNTKDIRDALEAQLAANIEAWTGLTDIDIVILDM